MSHHGCWARIQTPIILARNSDVILCFRFLTFPDFDFFIDWRCNYNLSFFQGQVFKKAGKRWEQILGYYNPSKIKQNPSLLPGLSNHFKGMTSSLTLEMSNTPRVMEYLYQYLHLMRNTTNKAKIHISFNRDIFMVDRSACNF